ncbi:hypothetical protein SPOG_04491 [Schizosaccharomyces cryophilus OY26]|uniref:Uncharacterized protein n=1 Tax=Schizosaccharomyces cryophilus (strain OY26 / ATCC MYA-4695 / CBS 11777 / NBRC 106824 / NRRL Y48691) TaxID=653667 RepID=S9W4R0_SCHCR|nr:uncharacterized protein SPOG_04491 [Schizosaccharomyces cryophilus OY26]EPY53509.1 hypothetical protein SPOG_04491 [Schizosaccharomyces cryophilus OY26]
MKYILTILLSLILTAKCAHSAEIYLRRGFDNSTLWRTVERCISLNFDGKVIVDRASKTHHDRLIVWGDCGNNVDYDFDQSTSDAILQCIYSSFPNATIDIRSHNGFAVGGSRYTDHDVEDFYNYFGRGYPIDYDPDYSSEGCEDSGNSQNSQAGDHNETVLQDELFGISNNQGYPDSRGKPKQYRNKLTVACKIDMMTWPHHQCRSRSPDGSKLEKGRKVKAETNDVTDVEDRTGSFWIQCRPQDGWPNPDKGSKVLWQVTWLN